jgi:hypothetical protein
MSEIKEIRTLLTVDRFSQILKVGFLRHITPTGSTDVHFYKHDIINLSKGEIVSKDFTDESLKFMLVNIDAETIREMVKRSPIFYELSNQI